MYTLYRHTFPNKKIYIGITGRKPEVRWQNGKGYIRNIYMWRAIQKYGWENVKHEILFENLTKEEAEQKEIELIALCKSNDPKNGYNISNGGNGANYHNKETREKISLKVKEKWKDANFRNSIIEHSKGKIISENQRKIISAKLKGKKLSKETREKISNTCKGKTNFKGKHHTQETKELLSNLRKGNKNPMYGKKLSDERKEQIKKQFQKKVICLDTGVVYPSILECSKETNSNKNCISLNCRGKLKSTNNLHFAYYKEVN